jgi:subtilase family serine protease
VSSSAEIRLDVTLKLPEPAAVTSFIASVSNRDSPNFHHFLRPGQFGRLFGAPLSEVAAVDAVLRSDGLHPGHVASNRLSIPVFAASSVVERAFHVSLESYRFKGGRTGFTALSPPSISTDVAPYVEGVVGLSSLARPQSLVLHAPVIRSIARSSKAVHPMTTGPTPCADAAAAASASGSYTADQLAYHYGMTPLYALDDFGQGVKVALVEYEPNLPSDVAEYQSCYGTNASVNYIPVDGGVSPGAGSGEAALDIEDVIGLAPAATIDVYQEPNGGDADTLDVYSRIMDDDVDQVVSISWGVCELDSDSSLIASEQSIFEQAATQGQTVFVAAGDNGSTDCYGDPTTTNRSTPSVRDPASQPYVVGVGGTTIAAGSETVWNDSNGADGAGGGGVSTASCMPSYQDKSGIPGMISSDSVEDPTDCGTADPYLRQVPDVSADADVSTGYTIYYTGTGEGFSGWGSIGGTSAAAPLWAAGAALIDSSPFCSDYGSRNAGVLPEGLYDIADSSYYGLALSDITVGDNDYTPSGYSNGLYPATKGYDMASGLGTPVFAYSGNFYPGLAAQMCFSYASELTTTRITGVSPNAGVSGRSASVTISGSGFLPIPGADRLEVGTTWITVSCESVSRCSGTLPAAQRETDNLVMAVEDMTLSPVSTADQFTFVTAPSVTMVTPSAGPAKGGTRVTIRGADFGGNVSVNFGASPARNVRVISSSEITATTPPRSGTIYVTLTAVGGSSKPTASGRFTFEPPPTVVRVTPAGGPAKGGTRVTIRGSNFVGTVSVHFGAKRATGVRVLSSSDMTADAPSGSGSVYVTVSALGGSSRKVGVGKFRY